MAVSNEKTKTFLETMLNNLDDIYEGTDEDVIKELEDMRIDIQKAEQHFTKTMEEIKKMRENGISEDMAERLAKDDMAIEYPDVKIINH